MYFSKIIKVAICLAVVSPLASAGGPNNEATPGGQAQPGKPAVRSAKKPGGRIVFFGDSITQGMVFNENVDGYSMHSGLMKQYSPTYHIDNRGLSGYNTYQAIQQIPDIFYEDGPADVRAVVVFFGANDAALPGGRTHVSVEAYEENLQTIINHPLIKRSNPAIVLITPPPVDARRWQDKGRARSAEETAKYANAVREVAGRNRVRFVDFWTRLIKEADPSWLPGKPIPGSTAIAPNEKLNSFLVDGLHLSSAAYKQLLPLIIEAVNAAVGLPAKLDKYHPHHSKVLTKEEAEGSAASQSKAHPMIPKVIHRRDSSCPTCSASKSVKLVRF